MAQGGIDEDENDAGAIARFPTGTEGIWTFVFIDMVIFTLIFLVYTMQRVQQYHLYEAAHHELSVVSGFVNTLILITSSLYLVKAVRAGRLDDSGQTARYLNVAFGLGLLFCVSKGIEYYEKVQSGIRVTTNSFFTFYFFITFLHLLHVLAGMTFMGAYRRNVKSMKSDRRYVKGLENVGHFWHFVDLLWIFIYALLYLM
jgi:nitric oxide reductase NorE protein